MLSIIFFMQQLLSQLIPLFNRFSIIVFTYPAEVD